MTPFFAGRMVQKKCLDDEEMAAIYRRLPLTGCCWRYCCYMDESTLMKDINMLLKQQRKILDRSA